MTLVSEALRYMDCKNADPLTLERAEVHLSWLSENAAGAYVTRELQCRVNAESGVTRFLNEEIQSADLARYISGCNWLILFAATLGTAAATHYRAVSAVSVADALIFDACASAFIEHRCDAACAELAKRHHGLTGRFSPGYGDFSLSFQPVLLNLLQAGKRIGLTVTDSYMLIPEKSVTAVIGIKQN